MRILDKRRLAPRRAVTATAERFITEGYLDEAWFERRFAAIKSDVEARGDLAVALKRVMLIALRQQPRNGADGVLPIRTMRSMAPLAGYSPAYISKLACAASIRLGRFIDLALALRAVQLVTTEGCTLNDAARRMGMGDASSVSSFICRATGTRPSKLTIGDVDECFHRMLEMLDAA
jgi:hypothetical protein